MRLLLVEDDKSLALAVAYRLRKEGFEVTHCLDGQSGWDAAATSHYDLVVLDRMMPIVSGDEMLAKLRAANMDTPVLMLTAMDGVADRVSGLDHGADDYLVKPFAMEELLARLRALMRRKPRWTPPDAIKTGDLSLNAEKLILTCSGREARLSRREAQLMELLMTNHEQTLPRDVLLDRVWADNPVEDGNLDIYIHFLRKHLRAIKSGGRIDTVRGVGYRLTTK